MSEHIHEYSIKITVSDDKKRFRETHKCECGKINVDIKGDVKDSVVIQQAIENGLYMTDVDGDLDIWCDGCNNETGGDVVMEDVNGNEYCRGCRVNCDICGIESSGWLRNEGMLQVCNGCEEKLYYCDYCGNCSPEKSDFVYDDINEVYLHEECIERDKEMFEATTGDGED